MSVEDSVTILYLWFVAVLRFTLLCPGFLGKRRVSSLAYQAFHLNIIGAGDYQLREVRTNTHLNPDILFYILEERLWIIKEAVAKRNYYWKERYQWEPASLYRYGRSDNHPG